MDTRSTIPTILIGDITGHAKNTYKYILPTLKGFYNNVEVWNDVRLNGNTTKFETIPQQAKQIFRYIRQRYPSETTYNLVGFSFGGHLAGVVATLLTQSDPSIKVFTCIMDTPATLLAQKYFKAHSNPLGKNRGVALVNDILAIINYVAQIYGLETYQPDHQSLQKLITDSFTFTGQAEHLTKHLIGFYVDHIYQQIKGSKSLTLTQDHATAFYKFTINALVVKDNLLSLVAENPNSNEGCNNNAEIHSVLLTNLLLLTTAETRNKYGCDDKAGWEAYTSRITTFPLHEDYNHLSLINETNGPASAKKIHAYFQEQNALRQTHTSSEITNNRMDDDNCSISSSSPDSSYSSEEYSLTSNSKSNSNSSSNSSNDYTVDNINRPMTRYYANKNRYMLVKENKNNMQDDTHHTAISNIQNKN